MAIRSTVTGSSDTAGAYRGSDGVKIARTGPAGCSVNVSCARASPVPAATVAVTRWAPLTNATSPAMRGATLGGC